MKKKKLPNWFVKVKYMSKNINDEIRKLYWTSLIRKLYRADESQKQYKSVDIWQQRLGRETFLLQWKVKTCWLYLTNLLGPLPNWIRHLWTQWSICQVYMYSCTHILLLRIWSILQIGHSGTEFSKVVNSVLFVVGFACISKSLWCIFVTTAFVGFLWESSALLLRWLTNRVHCRLMGFS